MILRLAFFSLKNRWLTTCLTLASISLGVALFLGIERVRFGVRESFSSAISQTDLIVGARGGSLPLLLYSVFHLGNATNNISHSSYAHFRDHAAVKWTIPYSLGDSHRGYRVVATNSSFYENYRYRGDQQIQFLEGQAAQDIFDVVIGAEVARKLKYQLGEKIVLAHGVSQGAAIFDHADKPFRVVGILKRNSTPIDRALYISLEGMEAIHMDWKDGGPPDLGKEMKAESFSKESIQIEQITTFLLRTKSRIDALRLQREILDFKGEPMMAIIPGVAMAELWNGVSYAEDSLKVVSTFVILVGVLGLLVALLTSLNERRREMAILRVMGMGASRLIFLVILETFFVCLSGIGLGIGLVYGGLSLSQSWIESYFGLFIPLKALQMSDYIYLTILLATSVLVSAIPAVKAYQTSLSDGLSLRV